MESTTSHTTETSETTQTKNPSSPAVAALAIVGFIALIALGILLAIYSARYVPDAVSKLTPPLGQIGNPNGLVVASSSNSTTIAFGNATTSDVFPSSIQTTSALAPISSTAVSAPVSSESAPSEAAPAQPALYGLPNLTTTIIATGYLANGTTASFIPAQVIPAGARAAVQFSIANTGTNVTGLWNFAATIPTQNGYVFSSPEEASMGPGGHVVFTLGFDDADLGTNEPITIIADPNDTVQETSKADNSASAPITVLPPQEVAY